MTSTTRLSRMGLRSAFAAAAAIALACASPGTAARRTSPAVRAASPLEVARAFYGALHGGDAEGAARLVGSPRARSATESFVKLANAYREMERAVSERFGAEAARTVGYADRIAAEEEALRGATAQVQGDDAIVISGGQTLATLRKVDGAWRVLLEDALATERGMAGLTLEAEASFHAAARVAPAIRQGLFDDPEDALEAFRNEVSLRMEGARPDTPESPSRAEPGDVAL